ncbi:ubiquitin carboxyl-terminal hydrolase 14 [Andrographis paniculata]|uniref:ubiquitin carboxyl-terminal hydrolase 14 n=1 Tax=Andrographis paniculata TaxID=175694 RepID=UPI0021E8E19F|nr:ubiquitin carboxyl-terminal hydrolase 14 [Andrographis paniculata]
MESLRSNLSRVRIPEPTNRIYKEECCISFDTPKSDGGLFVDMNSFLAFGKDYVRWNFEKTGNPVYLHITETQKLASEDRPSKKPTRLAIGIEGGFDNNDPVYEPSYEIVVLPEYVTLPFPSVELPEKVRLAVDSVIMNVGAEKKEQVASWTAETKIPSKHAMDLKQLDNGVTVPPSGWKCEKCDKTDNLWLNLTDGSILCGRRNWDGSGGNNHAVEHYSVCKYPLAVKLGTITADLEVADVFSYEEDASVFDPLLAQHLQHFGIDFSSLQKTEMTTAERELDHNTNFDWNRIQENGEDVEPLFGPGYTGLKNLGNSCYLAATMQVVFSTRGFCSRYYLTQSLKGAFSTAPADPTVDLNMQLTKLAHGLLSGKYSILASKKDDAGDATLMDKQEGIPPRMFKSVIAAKHPEFSTMRQQDALEFFLHFIDQVERTNNGNPNNDPSRSFKFGIEERLQCPSGKVAYNKRCDYILSLNIPLHKATNKKELEQFQKLKADKDAKGEELLTDEIVRPRVQLTDCLGSFSAPEELHDFYSTALNAKTTATKTAGLTSFPDYLVLHMRKFVLEEGWVPKKLDVYIDVPDTIDINFMRSKGLQPGEELLPDGAPEEEDVMLQPNDEIVNQLVSMGFPYLHCQKAAINTSNTGVEEAMNWLLNHMNDPDIDNPVTKPQKSDPFVDPSKVETLISFGFEEEVARKALQASGGDIEKATEWIFNPPSGVSNMDATPSGSDTLADAALPDGQGKYRLLGLVSHIGTSTHCGHYVAHIYKDGRWVMFNDEKVAVSKNPPIDMGYLYFFERIDG